MVNHIFRVFSLSKRSSYFTEDGAVAKDLATLKGRIKTDINVCSIDVNDINNNLMYCSNNICS